MAAAATGWRRRRQRRRWQRPRPPRRPFPTTLVAAALVLLPAAALARDTYSESLALRRVGRGGSRVYAQVTLDWLALNWIGLDRSTALDVTHGALESNAFQFGRMTSPPPQQPQATFDFLWELEPGQLCSAPASTTTTDDDGPSSPAAPVDPIVPCAHGLFPPALSTLVHAHGVQELSLSLANGRSVHACVGQDRIERMGSINSQPFWGASTLLRYRRWERDLWGNPTFMPPSDDDQQQHDQQQHDQQQQQQQQQQHHHTEPPYGAEAWARLSLPSADSDGQEQEHWRQLLEGLGALYHFPLGLAGASTAKDGGGATDGIAAANVIGGGGGGRVGPRILAARAFQLSLPRPVPRSGIGSSAPGSGYRLLGPKDSDRSEDGSTPLLRYAHLPAPAGLCTDALRRTLLGHGPSLLSPCRPTAGGGGGLGALLAVGLGMGLGAEGAMGRDRLLAADYLSYALELRRVCLEGAEEQHQR